MAANPVFHTMFSASDLEQAAITTLRTWFSTYLKEAESQHGIVPGTNLVPNNYTDDNNFNADLGEELPKVVVISPGITGTPEKRGDKQYSAWWQLGVGVAVADKDIATANALAKLYGATVRAIILQKKSLGGVASQIEWISESYDDLPIVNDQLKQYKAVGVYFMALINDVVTQSVGPTEPDQPNYGYGQVENVIIDLEKVANNAQIP